MATYYGDMMRPGKRDPILKPYRPTDVTIGWLGLMALVSFLLGGAIFALLRLIRVGLPLPLIAGLIFAAIVARRITYAVHGPPVPLPVPPLSPTTELSDRPFAEVVRWEDRLAWTHDEALRFSRTVRPAVSRIVEERLRQRHGIGLDSDRAPALLGPDLHGFLTGTRHEAPGPDVFGALVERMENL